MSPSTRKILEQVESWPEEDQQELAREIEARRKGVYVLNDDERATIAEARKGGFAEQADVAAFWRRLH